MLSFLAQVRVGCDLEQGMQVAGIARVPHLALWPRLAQKQRAGAPAGHEMKAMDILLTILIIKPSIPLTFPHSLRVGTLTAIGRDLPIQEGYRVLLCSRD